MLPVLAKRESEPLGSDPAQPVRTATVAPTLARPKTTTARRPVSTPAPMATPTPRAPQMQTIDTARRSGTIKDDEKKDVEIDLING